LTALVVLLTMLAVHRVTRLVVADEFPPVRAPREAIQDWFGEYDSRGNLVGGRRLGGFGRSVAYLVTCPWCMSVWVGGGIVWAVDHWHGLPVPFLVWAAASSFTGWAAAVEAAADQQHDLREHQLEEKGLR